jgi:hypothetical protein
MIIRKYFRLEDVDSYRHRALHRVVLAIDMLTTVMRPHCALAQWWRYARLKTLNSALDGPAH